jgi:hypothetical protein
MEGENEINPSIGRSIPASRKISDFPQDLQDETTLQNSKVDFVAADDPHATPFLIHICETESGNREILRDKTGKILGRFESDAKVTRDASGKITGRGSNQLLRLLK